MRFLLVYHIECHDVSERYLAIVERFHEVLVHLLRTTAGGQTKHEWALWGRLEVVDALDDVFRDVLRRSGTIVSDYESPEDC